MKRFAALILILLLCCPLAAGASGTWYSFTEDAVPREDLGFLVQEYTGTVTITFLGDCTLGGEEKTKTAWFGFVQTVGHEGFAYPFRNLLSLTGTDDLTVANLEGVLSDRDLPKVKKKYSFIGPTAFTEILREGSVECVTIANNHSHDYDTAGYKDTQSALTNAGIAFFGTDSVAVWKNSEGLLIGFLGVSGSLSGNRAKAYQQQAEKLQDAGCAAIITVMHAGTEYSYDPPDGYQKQITNLAVPVSSLIIGHHPHVVQGYTLLNGVPVVYSLGNCVFGGNTMPRDFDALVVQAVLHFTDGSPDRIDLHFWPIRISSDSHYNNYSPRFLADQDARRVLQKMAKSTGADPGEWNEAEGAVVSVPLD